MVKWSIGRVVAAGLALVAMASVAMAQDARVVAFGDSLMAGFNLPPGADFPTRLEAQLQAEGYGVTIVNAAVSGDTTSGGLGRLDWSVPDDTDLVILELGGNDALRGIDPDLTRNNLDAMIERLIERDIDVILAGILAPPNMGDDYAARFNPIFPELAAQHDIPLDPFFLDGAITIDGMMQADGIHPTAAGVDAMVARFAPLMRQWLDARANEN